MARGWESKSVEEQREMAATPRAGEALSPEEAALRRRQHGVRLARARVAQQLAATANERYAQLLRDELAALDRQLVALDAAPRHR